jgi:hypothetical protein
MTPLHLQAPTQPQAAWKPQAVSVAAPKPVAPPPQPTAAWVPQAQAQQPVQPPQPAWQPSAQTAQQSQSNVFRPSSASTLAPVNTHQVWGNPDV